MRPLLLHALLTLTGFMIISPGTLMSSSPTEEAPSAYKLNLAHHPRTASEAVLRLRRLPTDAQTQDLILVIPASLARSASFHEDVSARVLEQVRISPTLRRLPVSGAEEAHYIDTYGASADQTRVYRIDVRPGRALAWKGSLLTSVGLTD